MPTINSLADYDTNLVHRPESSDEMLAFGWNIPDTILENGKILANQRVTI
jgi:hypothetical protein